ncbi:MAG: hypothetical protein MZV70_75635 [Desulfobacterales bacterium]|nr:hypothetical protein [Desulfobacterales bacterium]
MTSLKLYLETFAKHELPREEQLKYIGFMLQDVERLSGQHQQHPEPRPDRERQLPEGIRPDGRPGGDAVRQFMQRECAIFSATATSAMEQPGRNSRSCTP